VEVAVHAHHLAEGFAEFKLPVHDEKRSEGNQHAPEDDFRDWTANGVFEAAGTSSSVPTDNDEDGPPNLIPPLRVLKSISPGNMVILEDGKWVQVPDCGVSHLEVFWPNINDTPAMQS
jgi:hypothetical protein